MPNSILDSAQVGNTSYDLVDKYAVHTINEIAPTNGELSTVLSLSIANGKLCQTYTKTVEEGNE